MRIEIVFALPERQFLESVEVPDGAVLADVIRASSLAKTFPGLDHETLATGIWGKIVAQDTEVQDGDRVELYRPLEIDPREARRQKAGPKGRDSGPGRDESH